LSNIFADIRSSKDLVVPDVENEEITGYNYVIIYIFEKYQQL